jgi:hypothetical protein
MRTNLFIATAIAGSMLITGAVSGSAQAVPAPVLKSNAAPGIVTLARQGGGGGGMKGMSRGGGGGMKSMSRGGGGNHALRSGGGNRGYAVRNGGGSNQFKRGSSGGNYALKNRGSSSRNNYAVKDRNYKSHDTFKRGGREHYASKDRNHNNGNFNNRHRVFRNGAWVWVYGPAYTAYGNDCYWLRRQANITGSPYWWSRYNQCVGYDYY